MVNKVTEIEGAIERSLDALGEDIHAELLQSLSESRSEITRGEFLTEEQLREEIRGWAGK